MRHKKKCDCLMCEVSRGVEEAVSNQQKKLIAKLSPLDRILYKMDMEGAGKNYKLN